MDKCINYKRQKLNTTFAIKDLLLIIALLLFLFSDFVQFVFFEILWLCSVIILIVLNYENCKHYHNEKIIKAMKLFIISVLFLFLLHLAVGSLRPESAMRLYGLTKRMLIPCIMFYCFYKNDKLIYLWKIVVPFLVVLNIVFFYAHIIVGNPYADPFGSVNVIGGLNIIVLPLVLFRVVKNRHCIENLFNIILIFLIVINAIIFDATTYKYLFYGFTVLLIFSFIFKSKKYKKLYCNLAGLAVLCLIILPIILVITKILPTDFFLYQNRYIIWARGYNQFGELSIIEQILGSGNNIVRMESNSFEAHNITMDVLMIYGWVGVVLLFFFFWRVVGYSKKINNISKRSIFMTTLLIYTIVCFMNPYFTGVTYFQIISWATIFGFTNINDAQIMD